MKKILIGIGVIFIILLLFVAYNSFTFKSKQINPEPFAGYEIPSESLSNFSKSIQIKTISHEDPVKFDSLAFRDFKEFVKDTYPLVDSLLEVTYINEFSMLIKWPGSNRELKPVIFMGHIDVVPVPGENIKRWSVDPFSGLIKDGYIWGRGSLDDKISVIGNLEAAELLLTNGFEPIRSIYFAFGHDEEVGGQNGAVAIVEELKKQNVQAEFVIDEGYAIAQGMIPGMDKDVALIGTAEKGFLTLHLSVELEGGHSSMPAEETAIDVLASAVTKLKKNPLPAQFTQPLNDFIAFAGPEMSSPILKTAFANATIFRPVIINAYTNKPSGNALIRTTTSPTIFTAGIKDNVIPIDAKATVNFRVLPGTSLEEVKKHVMEVINDDRIKIKEGGFSSEAPKSSSVDALGFQVLHHTIKEVFPEVVVAPNLVVGATDSRHFYAVSDQIYRFIPYHINNETTASFHGVNERVSVKDFKNAINFYARLIYNSTK